MENQINRGEMRAIIEHFEGKPVTDSVLEEYCKLKGYQSVGLGEFEDWKYQYEYDQRMADAVPQIMEELAKFQFLPDLASETDRKAASDDNSAIEYNICEIIENTGILYSEIDLVTSGLRDSLSQILNSVSKRVNNMAAGMIAEAAKEKWGKDLVIKALGEANRKQFGKPGDDKKAKKK